MNTKQVIAIRTDLKLRRGKECAQVAHAASMWLRNYAIESDRSASRNVPGPCLTLVQLAWLAGNYRKIVVKAQSEKQLRDLCYEAEQRGLTTHPVIDDGLTECPAGTMTAVAIGPAKESDFDGLTDQLQLY